jgi:folate-dependent phosphoribosylglycinamide formyltransferase PurN
MSTDLVPFDGGVEPHKEDYDPRDLVGFPGEYRRGRVATVNEIESAMNLGYLEGTIGKRPTNVAVVVDRGPLNLRSLGDFSETHPAFAVTGVLAPGSELDNEVLDLARGTVGDSFGVDIEYLLRPAREDHVWVHRGDYELRQEYGDGSYSPLFRYVHEAYDIKKMRQKGQAGEIEREEFCDRLILQLLQMNPSVVFLDNFKVFLAPNIVRAFKDRIVNIHPSVLPLIKGYRPEKRAFEGEHPEANGYTLHIVNEEMDRGATLFQQRVPVLPVDEDMQKRLGETEYATFREEQARLRIMYAQSRFVPWVLAIYASDMERKVVEGAEAFAAEGRPGFEQTEDYAAMLEKDDRSYLRMVFKNPAATSFSGLQEWVTLEHLLRSPETANVPSEIGGLFEYEFTLPRQNGFPRFGELITLLEEAGVRPEMTQLNVGDVDVISLRALGSCATILAQFGVSALQERMPTHVLTPRKPIKRQEAILPY